MQNGESVNGGVRWSRGRAIGDKPYYNANYNILSNQSQIGKGLWTAS